MKRVEKPSKSVKDVIENTYKKETDNKKKLDLWKEELIKYEKEYIENLNTLFKIPKLKIENTKIEEKIINEQIYNQSKNYIHSILNSIYDYAGNSICPICEKTLSEDKIEIDHILPKGKGFFHFAITPINLVRICGECNNNKGTKITDVHPYHNYINIKSFIKCILEKNMKPRIEIYLRNQEDENYFLRVKRFIKLYKLDEIYTKKIQNQLKNIIAIYNKQDREITLNNEDYKNLTNKRVNFDKKKLYKKNFRKEINRLKENFFYDEDINAKSFEYLIYEALLENFDDIINEFIYEIENFKPRNGMKKQPLKTVL